MRGENDYWSGHWVNRRLVDRMLKEEVWVWKWGVGAHLACLRGRGYLRGEVPFPDDEIRLYSLVRLSCGTRQQCCHSLLVFEEEAVC